MAFVTPTDVTVGSVLTASKYNQEAVANVNALYVSARRIAIVDRTTTFTVSDTTDAGTTNVFSSNLSWTADGTSAYLVEFYCAAVSSASGAGAQVVINLNTGSGTDLGRISGHGRGNGTQASLSPAYAVRLYTPAAGAATLNVRAWRTVGNGSLDAGSGSAGQWPPMFLAVYGPALT
jgi:hypothetical protein